MKLNKKDEAELMKVYNAWWHSYLNGDIKTYDFYLDDDYRFVGSTGSEEFLNRKDTTAFFEATAEQLAGNAKLENIIQTIETLEGMVLITDLADTFVRSGSEWVYYARFRFTSLLRKTKNGWRFFYQHFSTPDLKAQEGETIGLEKVTAENLELRSAIKRRTAELELKNRELEVEAALERIRAQVTAMSQSSDLLDIVVTMRTEFVKLGHAAHYFWHMRWLPEKYEKAMTSGDGTRIGFVMQLPRHIHGDIPLLANWEKSKESTVVYTMNVEEAISYVDKMVNLGDFQSIDPQAPTHDDIRHIKGLTFIMARTTHGEIGYSLPGVVKNPPKEDLDILVRFASAFDLAHKRFEDLRKSERQARETKIELGLERVRARAMGMQNSTELSDLVDTVFKELAILDFALQACIINLIDIENLCNTVWMKSPDVGNVPDSYLMKFEDYPFHDAMKEGYLKRDAKFIYTIQGTEKKKYDKYLFKDTEFRKISEEAQESFTSLEKYVCSFTFSNFGGLQTIGQEPLSDENLDILARFGKVFDLTYTRFNDLKLAEAQARESRIELALERVRARTMAMQQSEELGDVATVLFKELNELVENLWTCGFVLCERDRPEDEWWLSTEEGFIPPLFLPNVGDATHHNIYEAWKNGASYHTEQLEGDALQEHYDWLMTIPAAKETFDDMKASGQDRPSWQKLHCAYFSYGYLVMITEVPCPEEAIFKRFAKVFDQTYTRFLDLQKSEKQAREAEIELALERVRARTMAMQQSEELAEVATVLFQQVGELGIPQWTCGFNIWETGDTHFTFYPGGPDGEILASCKVPLTEHPIFAQFDESRRRGDELLVYEKEGEIQADHYRYMHSLPGIGDMLQGMLDSGLEFPTYQIDHVANFLYGNIIFVTYEPFPEMHDVFKRFAKVFEQTYTRFLDLQKAEAQAREAQIEASLERVRSRSMAMHQSDELKDVIKEIFEQMAQLNINAEHAGIVVDYEPKKDFHFWVADNQDIPAKITVPYLDLVWDKQFTEAKEKGKDFFITHLNFEEKNSFYKQLLPHIDGLTKKARDFYFACPGLAASTAIQKDIGIYIENFSGIPYTDEENSILLRIGKVFQQTYTRFLDLQKAEAQARESQIEAALERVRASSMAMHKTQDIADVVVIFFRQLKLLRVNFVQSWINVIHLEEGTIDVWFSPLEGVYDDSAFFKMPLALFENTTVKSWKAGESFSYGSFNSKEEVEALFHACDEATGSNYFSYLQEKLQLERLEFLDANYKFGAVSKSDIVKATPEEEAILKRFAKVFEQAYTRFLDLQNAEAQARESQIEAALEKVRSRSLAMHKPDELGEVVGIVLEKLQEIGITNDGEAVLWETKEGSRDMIIWLASDQNFSTVKFFIPYLGVAYDSYFWDQFEKGLHFCTHAFSYEEKNEYFNWAFVNSDWKYLPDERKTWMLEQESQSLSVARAEKCGISIPSYANKILTEQEGEILLRFSKVFEQAYTRFLDLQKSEAQAREAEIELALERVRARTMAMQHSTELADTSALLFQQIQILGVSLWSCGFNIWEKEDTVFTSYMGSPDGGLLKGYKIPLTEEAAFIRFKESRDRGDKLFIDILEGDALETHYQYFQALPGIKEMFEKEDQAGRPLPSFQIHHLANFSHGNLMFITYEHCSEAHDIFIRFAKVFEQTYTRFLDLQKAEAQAREAQIETALEKVRSRTMAMQKGEELKEVVVLLYKELIALGVTNFASCGYVEINEQTKKQETWVTSPGGDSLGLFYLPLTGDVHFDERYKAWKKGQVVFHQKVAGKERKKHLEYAITTFNSKEAEEMVLNEFPDPTIFYCFNFSHGYLHLVSGSYLNEEEESLLARFTRVFEQTYARFLDLKKAEAQAREAQIETALERVRSRTMAMHNSSELADTAAVLFQQLKELEIDHERTNIGIVDEANGKIDFWLTTQKGNLVDKTFSANIVESDTLKTFYKGYKEKRKSIIVEQKGVELKRWISFITDKLGIPYTPPTRNEIRIQNVGYISQGMIIATSINPLNDESLRILERFAAVFEQTYTRFLDLQKAEAQAREAQIEAALERLRSRTMAMQNSTDLAETSVDMFKQMQTLGMRPWACGFNIFEKDERAVTQYMAGGDGLSTPFTMPLTEEPFFIRVSEARQRGDELFVEESGGHELEETYKYMFSLPGSQKALGDLMASGFEIPKFQISHCAFFSQGYLMFITYEPCPEAHDIFKRFAKVFQQTYTRFLDLQKAEAQAREAEIELGLERVRAKAMEMHKSSDLNEVVGVLYQQVNQLQITAWGCALSIFNQKENYLEFWISLDEQGILPTSYKIHSRENAHIKELWRIWENQLENQDLHLTGPSKVDYDNYVFTKTELKNLPPKVKKTIRSRKDIYTSYTAMNCGLIALYDSTFKSSKETFFVIQRFAQVFDQAYTRFLDLQKAEAQARESQIEAALERVRSKTMAMHNSQDVGATVGAMFDELVKLGIEKSVRCGIGILDHIKPMELWTASSNKDGEVVLNIGFLDMSLHPLLKGVLNAWKKKETNFTYELKGKDLLKYFTVLNESPDYLFHVDLESLPKKITHNSFPFSEGTLFAFSPHPLTEEEEQIFKRFSGVFAQTYTRYLDLLKAEAQAREAEIEAALERVRSQTMAMHNSQDVGKTVVTFFEEVMKLDLNKSIRCGIGILEDREKMETWSATSYPNGDVDLQVGLLDMKRHPLIKGLETAWKNKEDGYSYELIGEDVVRYYEQLVEEPDYPFHVDLENLSDMEYHKSFFFSSGIIFAFTKTPISEEAALVLNRFASVFGQTYRRFLDLQKAEAQAREAQIEAALEKVRGRTMAMQSSSELQEAANVLFLEIQALGINAWSAGYNILSDDKTTSTCWMSSEGELQDPFPLYYTEEASFIEMGKFLKGQEEFFIQELAGKDLEQHYDYMKSLPELKDTFKHIEDVGLTLPTYQINHLCKFSQGYLLFITYETVPEAREIFKRFTKVFEQTYTRFLDLQKAETQSKEAQIELALERVRASTMAMHKSEQLAGTAQVLFEQFDLLGIIPDRISIAIFNEKKRIFELWATDQSGTIVDHVHDFSIDEPTCMAKTYQAWKEGKETYVVDLKGNELKDWIRFVKEEAKMKLDDSKFKGRRVQHSAFFSQGYLLLSSHLPIKDEMMQLLLRFAKVFQQTFTRFLDLQKAETQARDTVKRASVDRVRAEIASMRTTNDLKRITPLVWNELTTLNVPFIRCGVFIMDEEQQQVQTHLSTPDGKAIASFNLPFENTEPLTELLPYWRKKEMYTDHWDESAFIESTKILMQRGAIASSEKYATEKQPTNLHLHFLPFLQGMLYVGSEVPLGEDEMNLAQNLAEAFSTAFSRYEDFNKLELANKKIEKTLVDLKQTQTQLIQSEKMASLGELTAGIAHEIQNPLNFVNNFSEVSHELMKEMLEELERGDLDEAKEISHDIEQNLEKINHHGKRASDIVKGMLQHSRKGDGKKDLTDINKLADEYLRLAYHGLRAKDKSFNADFSENFEEGLPLIQAIPQDIGRVLLNLISNAFHAVSAKDKEGVAGYKPTVVVSTKKINDLIEINVKDNGSGVSESIRDKIFQPFFTTKPTGQGTGLGLSMSYDIITKGHGGSLDFISTEGEGSEFIIQLPLQK